MFTMKKKTIDVPIEVDTLDLQIDPGIRISRKVCPADWAIMGTLIAPIVFDIWAWRKDCNTVSIRFGEFLTDPKSRAVATVIWIGITAHLFSGLPLPGQKTLKIVVTRKRKSISA